MRTEERSDRPVGDLVQQLSQQTAALVRQEMRLAQDIEETRAELGDTVETLSRKADVKAQRR